MRRKSEVGKLWFDICDNCERGSDFFAGVFSGAWTGTLKYVEQAERPEDKFSLAILAKDAEAIDVLYEKIPLNDYQKKLMTQLLDHNEEVLLTLNPFVLDPKYDFLNPVIDELVLDKIIQDKLLSLDDYELSILKRIVEHILDYDVNPNNLVAKLIDSIGCSSIPGRNDDSWLDTIESIFKILRDYENNSGVIDDKILETVAMIFKNGGFIPSSIDEIINFNTLLKDYLKEMINREDVELNELKNELILRLFSMRSHDALFFLVAFNIQGMPEEYYSEPGVVELMALKMIKDTKDINKLKEVASLIIDDPDYEFNLFNNNLMEENLLLLYAREFNKCRPKFEESNYLETKEGIKFYDSGNDFYAIVKTLGAFSHEGRSVENYYLEWNSKRYRSHVNAVSLVRNDNLAFAEQDGYQHVKLGFLNFDESRFLGGGKRDINSAPDSRDMGVKIYSSLYFPGMLIDSTREWHNELDYDRKNNDGVQDVFKKNPDFIILDQEVEDISVLEPEDRAEHEKILAESLKAAKDFGNLPVLVINRERIAKNEVRIIREMLDKYIENHDIDLLINIITRFNNNRNGCRGKQHKYIRENYFSNEFYQELLNEIDDHILDEQREAYDNHLRTEYERMSECSYDKTTLDLPKAANRTNKKGVA